ncbi:MAG TPA: Rid family detoxifying hydrolase [Longimicrobiales bacterium]
MFKLRGTSLLFTCACACACASPSSANREVIAPRGASTVAPYSPAIRHGDLVFLSGQIGLRPGTRELAAGGVSAETEQALENVRTVLDAAGLTPADVVKCTVFLADMRDYDAMNTVYGRFFVSAPPARSAVGVNGLPLGARVEIECIARGRS